MRREWMKEEEVLASLSSMRIGIRRRPQGLQRAATIPGDELAATVQMAHDALNAPLSDVDLGETDQSDPETCRDGRGRASSGDVKSFLRKVPDPLASPGAATSRVWRPRRRLRRPRGLARLGVVVLIPVIVIVVFIAIAMGSTP
jgi:hypothetical protein